MPKDSEPFGNDPDWFAIMTSLTLDIIFEDNHLIAINKPTGVLVQGDETGDKPLVEYCKDYIKKKYNKPGAAFLGVVHRLDRPVSGVVIFARTSKSLSRLNASFRLRETGKIYWAVTDSQPPTQEGELIHWLKKDEVRNKTMVYARESPGAKESVLRYRTLEARRGKWLLEVCPVTGRSHQIRVQLSSMGCPILGDRKYGSEIPSDDGSIGLHARSLSIIHPVKKESLTLEAKLPGNPWWDFAREKIQ